MNRVRTFWAAVLCGGWVVAVPIAQAGLLLSSNLQTTAAGNLVTNGSFEVGAPASGVSNQLYWATGTASTPFSVPAGWSSSGGAPAYAVWGNDGNLPPSLRGSDSLPDGNVGMYFGNGAPVLLSQAPTFQADGSVTFVSPPSLTTFFSPVPVVLSQTVNTPAFPASAYHFSFWVSGEDAGTSNPFAERGIFGLRVTNALPGDPIQYLAVPSGTNNAFGPSHLYEYVITPLNPLLPVTIEFINWGHFDLTPFGGANFTTELVLDHVIINAVPELGASALGGLGFLFAVLIHRFAGRGRVAGRVLRAG
jgi:hypothetical protein